MERIRKPFQGVMNIIRFNWHYYFLSLGFVIILLFINKYLNGQEHFYINLLSIFIILSSIISLIVSFYVYDVSNLYQLNWLDELKINPNSNLININAGFDETSILLNKKFNTCRLQVFDFYDPKKHTEISIKRARQAYSTYKGTLAISTLELPVPNNYADCIFLILSAHEIRNNIERVLFLKELNRILNHSGKIIITEHLRDLPNFIAYNIGFFHFMFKSNWISNFSDAGFAILNEIKITPFITTFVLIKNGNTP